MAEINLAQTRLLGVAPLETIDALVAALTAVPGPKLWIQSGPGIAAVLQSEPPIPLVRRGRKAMLEGLHTVQRRLEIACQAGPFLPMDPAAATCPGAVALRVLGDAWTGLAAALDRFGRTHQWDIVLRWPPESVVASHREEIAEIVAGAGKAALAEAVAGVLRAERTRREGALLAALAPATLALRPPVGAETEIAVTALIPAGGEAAIEAALQSLPTEHFDATAVDLRGPLPPLSFAAIRLTTVEQGEVASAWRRLGLPDRIDAASLHRHWRQLAASLHPDRNPDGNGDGATVADATDAYRILRSLLPDADATCQLPDLLRRAGYRLILPGLDLPEHAAEHVSDAPVRPEAAMLQPVLS